MSAAKSTLGKVAGRKPMPSALYFLKSIFVWGNHSRIIHSPHVVMMCDEKKYNPQGGSLLACIVTQGRLRCTCQPCAIESITPMGYGHTVWFGAIECAIRWDMDTPRGWRGLSNVQCDAVMAHRVVWWSLVGAAPVCPPVSPCRGASIVHSRT